MIRESSINRCWEEAMKYFLTCASSKNLCGREYMVLDTLNVQAYDYILESTLSCLCPWQLKSREYYLSQITSPGKHSEMTRMYEYGPGKVNQYKYAIGILNKRKNMKPVVISIYDPYKDNRENVPTPCISTITLDTYGGIVNMQVNYSTMNLFRMGLLDYHQMASLHQHIANDSNKQVGSLNISAVQVHMPIFDYWLSRYTFQIPKTDDSEGASSIQRS